MSNATTTKKERNYSIDFWRMFLTICFVGVHTFIVIPSQYLGVKTRTDVFAGYAPMMVPFFLFTGYFLMHAVRRTKLRVTGELNPITESVGYLKKRLIYFYPALIAGQLFGFVTKNLYLGTPITQWPMMLLDSIWEILGFQLTGLGMGNSYVGLYKPGNTITMMNGPLWYICGILILGYVIYFLLMKYEHLFVGIVFPIGWMLTNGAYNINNHNPFWGTFLISLPGFPNGILNDKLIHMFFGFGLGCTIYCLIEAINKKYKNVEFKKSTTIWLTIVSAFTNIFLVVNMFANFKVTQNTVWGICIIVCFIVLLDRDYFTKFMSRSLGFIIKPMGGLVMYIYIFHYPLILPTYKLLGKNNPLLVYIVVVTSATIVSAIYHQLHVKVLEPWLSGKNKKTVTTTTTTI